jgi:acyl-CoA thioester hydrolase
MPQITDPTRLPEYAKSWLADFRTVTELPVQWGDQDAFGHVNNVMYFRWFESARIDLLSVCPSGVTMSGKGLGPILASISCNYRRQLRFPDAILIGSRISRVGRSSADISHIVISQSDQAIVADGSSVIVVFDYDAQRVTRIPDDLRIQFESCMTAAK